MSDIFDTISIRRKMGSYRDDVIHFSEQLAKTSMLAIDGAHTLINDSTSDSISSTSSVLQSGTDSQYFSTIWGNMMREYYKERDEIEEYRERKTKKSLCNFPKGSVLEYMESKVFAYLFPALTETLIATVRNDSIANTNSTFDVLDNIAEYLWNNNPNYSNRLEENLNIHDMPWVQAYLAENPRPFFPKSSIYTPEIAAKKIQAFYRGYVIRKREDVHEMRSFWKILNNEKEVEREVQWQNLSDNASTASTTSY